MNIFQIFNHNSWSYVDGLIQTYGPLSKVHGFFGVRFSVLNVYSNSC